MVMQLGPTSSKRIVLSYFLPRGLEFFSIIMGIILSNVSSYLQMTGKLYQEVQEVESLSVLNKTHSKTPVPAPFNIIKLSVPLLSSVRPCFSAIESALVHRF